MNSEHVYPVVIVGGGPCGMLTALLLGRSGIECALFERHPDLLKHPKAMSITGRTLEIFRTLGLDDELRKRSLDMHGRNLSVWSRKLVGGEEWGHVPFPVGADGEPLSKAIHCPQTATERVLLDALEKEETVSIFFDHKVVAVDIAREGVVTLSVQRPAPSIPMDVRCQYLVAADGAGSPVRHLLGVASDGPGDQGHFLNVYFRARYGRHLRDRRAVLYQVLDRDLFEGFVAVNGEDLWLMHHFLMPGQSPSDFTNAKLVAEIQLASGVPDEPVEILGVSPWVMSPKVASTFRTGRVFFAGDAAARLSPTGGLGMNTGLQAAHNLVWKLAAVLCGAPDSILDTYETERRVVALESFHVADGFRKEVFDIVEAGLEGDFDTVKQHLRVSGRRENPGEKLGVQYAEGAFIPREISNADGVQPGMLLPAIVVATDEGEFPIQHWIGYDWVLLAVGDAAEWQAAAATAATHSGNLIVREIRGGGESVEAFAQATGVSDGGAILVRPDGFIAWVCPGAPADPRGELDLALRRIFS